MPMERTDLIIIGSGPGGYHTAAYAAKHGLHTVVVEAAEAGGTCLNCGCIPTKTLCRSAEVADTLREAGDYGFGDVAYTVDFGKVMERKRKVVEALRGGVETLMQAPGITFVRGRAAFTGPHTVSVGDVEYTAPHIIVATGSKPKMPPVEGIGLPGVLTSTGLLDIADLPRRLCIVGAGVIGMEFASIFSSFGSEVTVVEFLKETLPTLDSDIAKRLRQCIGKRGVTFHMQSAVKTIAESTSADGCRQLTVSFEKKGKPLSVDADVVLIATGRAPYTDGLQFDKAGIECARQGICVDGNYQTNVEGVYAIGDVNGKCLLAHAASFQGMHVVNRILGRADNIDLGIVPSAIFTRPEAASVGRSEDSCKADGIECVCRKAFYRANGKAMAMGETDGMLKLVSDSTGRILGCHVFGPHAADIVQEVAALMCRKSTVADLADMVHTHPTLAEILHDAALS